jgi:thiamine pyrophosphate-dependent acetolactate synthase large subunit-like protein
MNGAETLVQTLLASGVRVCFANPGTSEMHFVAALDRHPELRCILCLFEGGVSGAADGYYRMTGEVAATLLHLAPGFGNAFANLHNARKAQSGVLNIMGITPIITCGSRPRSRAIRWGSRRQSRTGRGFVPRPGRSPAMRRKRCRRRGARAGRSRR